MSARDTILLALTRYYRGNADPRGTAMQVLDGYDAARRTDLLAERADVRDRLYRDAYETGRAHAGADGWALDSFDAVFSLSDGGHREANELRHRDCGHLVQGVGAKSLLDLMALAAQHQCPTGGAAHA